MLKLFFRLFKRKQIDEWKPAEREPLPIFYTERKIEQFFHSQYPAKRNGELSDFFNFNFAVNLVLFIDTTENIDYFNYINQHSNEIKNNFSEFGRNFNTIPIISNNTALVDYKYYFPLKNLNFKNFDGISKESYGNFDQSLLNFLNYKGEIKTGLLTIKDGMISFVEKLEYEDIDVFFEKFLKNIIFKDEQNQLTVMYSIDSNKKTAHLPIIQIDDETLEKVEKIKLNVQELVESGNFFLVAPMIEKILQESYVISKTVSPLKITADYRILLTDYDIEVEMNHLTKSIYFLFLQADEEIDITNLQKYRDKLLNIYKHISNKNSLEDLEKTIDDVTAPNNKNIYMHISRVRSAYANLFSNTNDYVINGVRGQPKSIYLKKELIRWEVEF